MGKERGKADQSVTRQEWPPWGKGGHLSKASQVQGASSAHQAETQALYTQL